MKNRVYKMVRFFFMICFACIFIFPAGTVSASEGEEGWMAENDAASVEEGTVQEVANGTVSVEVDYTSGIQAKAGDTFDIVYQIIGSGEPATITLNADEIDGYVGMIDMAEGTYEILDVQYTGKNPEITSYAIENTFHVTDGGGDTICLVIGGDGALNLSGQDGYFITIGEEDMVSEASSDDTEEGLADQEEKENENKGEIKNPGMMRFILLLFLGVLMAAGVYLAKKKGMIDD